MSQRLCAACEPLELATAASQPASREPHARRANWRPVKTAAAATPSGAPIGGPSDEQVPAEHDESPANNKSGEFKFELFHLSPSLRIVFAATKDGREA